MQNWHVSPILERYFGSASYALVAILALALLAAWVVGVLATRLPLRRRLALAALRLLAVLVLILAMLRPERIYTELQKQSATLAVLVDRSRSMGLEDTISGNSRWLIVTEAFGRAAPGLARLADDVEIRAYVFDAQAEAIAVEDGQLALDAEPTGDQSAYGEALRDVMRREDGKRLIAFILAGDGAQQTLAASPATPDSAAQQLDQAGCPLYTVASGYRQGARQARDIAVESMPDDLVVFVKNSITVTGTIRVAGYVNRDIPVQLVVETSPGNEEIVATETYRAVTDGEQLRYEFSYVPQQPGEYRVLVRAVPQEGEVTVTNNELPTYMTVLAGGLRALYIQGELRREQRFLRQALAASPDIEVTLLTISTRDPDRWPVQNLAEYFEPGAFDVYILGDIDSKAFHPGDAQKQRKGDLELLREAVQRGAGLLALGGWHTFRPGGYHKTPLAAVLPVEMDAQIDRFVRQNYGEPPDKGLHLAGPLQMLPADPWGKRHYLMRLAASDNTAAWEKLPPLTGANKFRGVKDGAVVLAEDPQRRPLLVAGEPGGRVLAFAGDSTWRWVMRGHGDEHRRFWRQAILWLARKDQITQGDVWVQLDSRRTMTGGRVTFSAGARSAEGDPLPDAQITAQLRRPDGTRRPVRLVRQGDQFRGAVADLADTGTYAIEVAARRDGAEIGAYEARFMVYTTDRELSGVTADPTLLENLADQTREHGGRKITPEELPALIDELSTKPLQLEEKVKLSVSYWDRGYVFLLLVGLLSTEWFLRKKWRLV